MTRWIAITVLLAATAASDAVVVKREGVRVMKAPRFFGEACAAQVAPGQRLTVVERRGGWGRVSSPGAGQCWIHESAWVDRKPGELAGGGAASQRDIELAGRGFSEDEVTRYAAENPDLGAAFALVDAYLARAPETPPAELAAFVTQGKLGGGR